MYIYRWTFGAKECFKRNLICGPDCSNYSACFEFIKKNRIPPMKDTVITLIRKEVPLKESKNENYY